jgi:hypothetical protein
MALDTLLLYVAGALIAVVVALALLAPAFIVLAIRAYTAALTRQREEYEALSRAARKDRERDQ